MQQSLLKHRLFISHYSGDKEISNAIGSLLSRVSLCQIEPWFSSDESQFGGLKPGEIWFNSILKKIEQSKMVIVLLTPNSIQKPWIYYESGIGQALEQCEIVPVCIGLNVNDVQAPLGLYQCYQLSDYRALKEFVSKVLNMFDIPFDEDAFENTLKNVVSTLTNTRFHSHQRSSFNDIPKLFEEVRNHIDKRFIELRERSLSQDSDSISYSVPVKIDLDSLRTTQHIEIRYDDSLSDFLNTVFWIIRDHVEPFSYLQTWALKIYTSKNAIPRFVGIKGVQELIPARVILKPEYDFEVVSLLEPYSHFTIDNSVKVD
ncbi:MAG: toll/interleukin-1 receptor domain-containing protein [Bacteroidota bacterium]